jgi:hypothetical protein
LAVADQIRTIAKQAWNGDLSFSIEGLTYSFDKMWLVMALAIVTDYFGEKPGGSTLAEALHEPFKFTVIALLPDR